mmetsp:Transcript_4280/g.9496  ORF Transcript_4280/g.9496 Transcript_4280/m.9496 type:complete len:93 (-) Transcript_4280:104-382(-)
MMTTKVAILMHMFHKDVSGTNSLGQWFRNKKAMTTTKAEILTRMFHRAVEGTRTPKQFLDGVCTCVVVPGRKLTEANKAKSKDGKAWKTQDL